VPWCGGMGGVRWLWVGTVAHVIVAIGPPGSWLLAQVGGVGVGVICVWEQWYVSSCVL